MTDQTAVQPKVIEEYLETTERRRFIAGAVTVSIAGVVIVALAVARYLWNDGALAARFPQLDREAVSHILNIVYIVVDGAAKATIVLSVAFTLVLRTSVRNIIKQVVQLTEDSEQLKNDAEQLKQDTQELKDETATIASKDPFNLDPQTGVWIKQWGDAGYRQEIERLTEENARLKGDIEDGNARLGTAFATLIEQIRNLKEELSRRDANGPESA